VLAHLVASFENKSGFRDLLIFNVVFPRTGCYLSFLKKDHREDWAPQGNNNHRIQPKARIEYFQEPMVSP
jgi:hypothetical protein